MPSCASCQQTMPAAGDRAAHKKQLAMSTAGQLRAERKFYSEYSARHPPKNRVPLIVQEEQRMAQLRAERDANGYSESFIPRRQFPIKPQPEPEEPDPAAVDEAEA